MDSRQSRGTWFSATNAGTANAIATVAAPGANRRHYVTDISGTADLFGALIQVRTGDTIIWQDKLPIPFSGASMTSVYTHSFGTPLVGTTNATVLVKVGTATSLSWANISGFTV